MGNMARSAPGAFGQIFGQKQDDTPSREAQVAEAALLTPEEREWLDAQMDANGKLDRYDQALLDFLAAEAS